MNGLEMPPAGMSVGGVIPPQTSDIAIPVNPEAMPSNPTPTKEQDVGNLFFEDYFPKLDLSKEQEDTLRDWFRRDLRSCVRNIKGMINTWATYRAVYMLEYVEKFYPSSSMSAEFASGVLCETMLKAMGRLKKAVFSPRPYFIEDTDVAGHDDIMVTHKAEWFLHTVFKDQLKIQDTIYPEGLFDFLMDGSLVLEADQMYEHIPQRVLKTYTTPDELIEDMDRILNKADYEDAMRSVMAGQPARVLIEKDVLTKNGLQVFIVDKVDHLIPPNVYNDNNVRFRGRRMYMTESDLRLLGSDGVGWYDKKKVDAVLKTRQESRLSYKMRKTDQGAASMEALRASESEVLAYEWRREEDDNLAPHKEVQPYKNTFAVYRITAKYGYKTKSDPKGLISKFCLFDFEPESGVILRARTYPHFEDRKSYFHFKLGFVPKSYWGFGMGARLLNEDYLQSNIIDLYLDGAAMATFRPFVCVHPEYDGIVPFRDGLGPEKIGFVKNINDFKPFEIPPPPMALIGTMLPMIQTRVENRSNITSLIQGRAESNDPRSPAEKTRTLLNEAYVGLDDIVDDFNKTGWEPLAHFVWKACYENAVFQGEDAFKGKIIFGGTAPDMEGREDDRTITLKELEREVCWQSQASAQYLNSQIRESNFLRRFQFFFPLLQALAQINPEMYKKYFIRWMRWAAQEMELRPFKYLIPTEKELANIPAENVSKMWDGMMSQLRSGQSPGTTNMGQSGGQ